MLLTPPDNILIQNLCEGARGCYKITLYKQPLATSYNVYKNRVSYGEGQYM